MNGIQSNMFILRKTLLMKMMKSFFLVLAAGILLSHTASTSGVIKSKYPFMVGEYELIVIYNEGEVEEPLVSGKITMKITKGDALTIYKDGKKIGKYAFNDRRAPIDMGSEDYVMFNKSNENYPMFFKGDSLIQFIYPNEFSDNYFRKMK